MYRPAHHHLPAGYLPPRFQQVGGNYLCSPPRAYQQQHQMPAYAYNGQRPQPLAFLNVAKSTSHNSNPFRDAFQKPSKTPAPSQSQRPQALASLNVSKPQQAPSLNSSQRAPPALNSSQKASAAKTINPFVIAFQKPAKDQTPQRPKPTSATDSSSLPGNRIVLLKNNDSNFSININNESVTQPPSKSQTIVYPAVPKASKSDNKENSEPINEITKNLEALVINNKAADIIPEEKCKIKTDKPEKLPPVGLRLLQRALKDIPVIKEAALRQTNDTRPAVKEEPAAVIKSTRAEDLVDLTGDDTVIDLTGDEPAAAAGVALPQIKQIKGKMFFTVKLLGILSPSEFMFLYGREELEQLEDDMNDFYETHGGVSLNEGTLKKGMIVAALRGEGWRRGEVICCSNSEEAWISFIDYGGNKKYIAMENLRQLEEPFALLSRKCCKGSLFGVKPANGARLWSTRALTDFMGLVHGKKLYATVKKQIGDVFSLALVDDISKVDRVHENLVAGKQAELDHSQYEGASFGFLVSRCGPNID